VKRKIIIPIIFIPILIVVAFSVFALHQWQSERLKNKSLKTGLKSYYDFKWEMAASNFGRYLAFCPNDINILLKYADAQLHIRPARQENLQQAIAAYRTVIRTDKSNETAVIKLSNLYLQLNAASEAENVTNRYLQYNSNNEIKTIFAISLARQRKFAESAELAKKMIKEYPEEIIAYELMSNLSEKNIDGLYGNPQYWLDLCVKNNPKSPEALISRAGYYILKNKHSDALTDLTSAELFDLSDPNIHVELANLYVRIDLFSKAKEHLNIAEVKNPAIMAIWETRAQIALKEGSKAEMLQVADYAMKALKNDPWDFMPMAAELMIKGEDLIKGCKYIEKLKIKEMDPPAVKWLEGLVAKAEGRDYESIRMWNIALKMGFDSEKIVPELIDAFLKVGDTESALTELRKKTIEQPESYKWHIQLARLAFGEQIYTEALQHSEKAISIMPNMFEPLLLKMKVKIFQPQGTDQISRCETLKNVIEELTSLTDVTSNLFEIELLKFTCSLECEHFEEAEQILNNLRIIHPNKLLIEAAYIDLLMAKKMNGEAELKLSELINQYPEDIAPAAYLCDVLSKAGKLEQSETVILEALSRIKDYESKRKLALMLTDIYINMNDTAKERTFINEILQTMPTDVPLRKKLIESYLNEKLYRQAQVIIDEIKKIEGDEGRQWKYLQAKLWCCDVFFENNYQQTVSLLKQNITDNPYDNASRLLLGYVYEKASEDQLALITYRSALNHRPYDINVKTHIIGTLFKVKEYDTAETLLNEAIKQDYVNGDVLKLNLRNLLRQNKISEAIEFLERIDSPNKNRQIVNLLIASLKIKNKEYESARNMLNELAAQEPNSLKIKSLLVELNIQTSNHNEALNLCNEIVNQSEISTSLLLRAHTYLSLGKIESAQKDFDKAIILDPNNSNIWEARGLFYRSMGKLDLAFNDLEKAYQLQLSNIDIVKYMLNSLPDINDSFNIWKCQQLLKHALVNYPKDPELLWYKARLLIAENKSSSMVHAENILIDVTKDNPKFSFGWSLLAEIYLNQNESGKAMDTILQGLRYCSQDKTLLLLKAKTEILSSPDIAVLTLEHLNKRIPNDIDIILLLSNTYISIGQNQKAIQLLRNYESKCPIMQKEKVGTALAIALYKSSFNNEAWEKLRELSYNNQNSFDISIAKCEIFYFQHDWESLKDEFDNLLRSHPERIEKCLNVVKSFLTSGNQPPPFVSEYLLRKILQYKPDYPPAIQMIAINLHSSAKFDEAAEFYQKLIQSDPNNKIAINNLSWILCENHRQYEKALELAQNGLKIHPDYSSLTDTRGLIYYRLGEFKKASQDFYESLNLNNKNSSSYVISLFHLGKTMNKMGYAEKAYTYLEKAVSLNQIQGGLTINEVSEAQNILTFLSNKSYAADSDK